MQKTLYFICPTDGLETIINATFRNENYYYTSLGNSVIFEQTVLEQIEKLVRKHDIQAITFVLANNNRIVNDTLGQRDFLNIKDLNYFYYQINSQQKRAAHSWQLQHPRLLLLSYYLHEKIEAIKNGLSRDLRNSLHFNGKIYQPQKQVFSEIYPDFVCLEAVNLN